MNKKITATVLLILAMAAFAPNSFAASVAPFEQYKIVGSSGSFTEKTVFGFEDPSPYLYMRLPENGQAFTGSFWRDPDATIFYMSTAGSTPDRDRWITLSDWATVKKVGGWEVNSNYFYTNGATGFGSTSFTVTPEPLAMTLFLIGGAPIAVNIYRRRRLLKV